MLNFVHLNSVIDIYTTTRYNSKLADKKSKFDMRKSCKYNFSKLKKNLFKRNLPKQMMNCKKNN